MRRPIHSLLAAMLLVGLLTQAPAATAAVASGAIVVKVVHSEQTITISVRLTLYPGCAEQTAASGPCVVTPAMAKEIQSAIERVWNAGYKYKCYTVKVQVDIQTAADPLTDAADRVGVRIDQSPVPIRSQVLTEGGSGDPFSSDPGARITPTNGNSSFGPTQWAYPASPPATYAHEFGHILGLSDTYTDSPDGSVDMPGSAHDLMNSGRFDKPPKIDPATIERLVKRQGIKDSELQCGWKGVYDAGGVTAKGMKCGKPTGTWVLHEHIAAAVSQQFTLEIQIRRDLTGTWHHTYTVGAGPVSVSGSDSGTAKFAYGPPPTMTVSSFGTIVLTPLADCKA